MTQCALCFYVPKSSDDKFYDIRFTKTGRYGDAYIEHKDIVVCGVCLEEWVYTNLDYLQSVRRIDNPLNAIARDEI